MENEDEDDDVDVVNDDNSTTKTPVNDRDGIDMYEIAGGIFEDDMIEKYSDNDGKI